MTLGPGEVTPKGDITLADGTFLEAGMVYVSLPQALKAHRFGWRIVECRAGHDMAVYAVRRRPNR